MRVITVFAALMLILCLHHVDAKDFAQEFLKSTDNEITGYNTELQIEFSVKALEIDRYKVTYRFNNKVVTIRISYTEGKQAAALGGIDTNTGEITVITPEENELLEVFLEKVLL